MYPSNDNYVDISSDSIGTTVSCVTLARMLNEVRNTKLSRKVFKNICHYFEHVKYLSAGIYGGERRWIIGEMLLRELDTVENNLVCEQYIKNVIRNVKMAYVKDLFIADIPLNYKNSHLTIEDYDET